MLGCVKIHSRLMLPFIGSQHPLIPTLDVVITLPAFQWLSLEDFPHPTSNAVPHATAHTLASYPAAVNAILHMCNRPLPTDVMG